MTPAAHRPRHRLSLVGSRLAWQCLVGAVSLSLAAAARAQMIVPKKEIQEQFPPTDLPFPKIAGPGFHVEPASTPWWVVAAWVAGGLLLLGLLIFLGRLARRPPQPPPHAPLQHAIEALEILRPRVHELTPQEAAHDVSLIVRTYLQGKYGVPAPFRTTEEIYGSPSFSSREPLRERFEPVAAFHDRLEFAPQPRTVADSEALVDAALRALREEQHLLPQPLALPAAAAAPSSTSPEADSERIPDEPPLLRQPSTITLEKSS